MNPFRIGDRVYIIDENIRIPVVFTDGDFVKLRLDDGSDLKLHYRKVSFSPWPAADHQRPLEDGVYLYTVRRDTTLQVGIAHDGVLYPAESVSTQAPAVYRRAPGAAIQRPTILDRIYPKEV